MFGNETGVVLPQNNGNSGGTSGDSNGTSDGGSRTPDGSDGTSNETAVITDEDSVSPTAMVEENVVAFGETLNIGQRVYEPR